MAERPQADTSNAHEFSVTELSTAIKRTLEGDFAYVRLRGEVSGYRGPHASGHCYFGIKDDKAKIDAVIWRGVFGKLKFKPEEGLEVIANALPVLPETAQLCQAFDLDPLGVIASGALLISVAPDDAPAVQRALEAEGIPAFDIGRVVEKAAGVTMLAADGRQPLPRFARDEIARLF